MIKSCPGPTSKIIPYSVHDPPYLRYPFIFPSLVTATIPPPPQHLSFPFAPAYTPALFPRGSLVSMADLAPPLTQFPSFFATQFTHGRDRTDVTVRPRSLLSLSYCIGRNMLPPNSTPAQCTPFTTSVVFSYPQLFHASPCHMFTFTSCWVFWCAYLQVHHSL